MNSDGTGVKRLTGEDFSWSPDGSEIAFDRIDRDDIFVVTLDGTERKLKTPLQRSG
jgi:Tol biopolymer transport system component